MEKEQLFKKLNCILSKKIYDYFFISFQYKGDLKCSLVDLLGRNISSENKVLYKSLNLDNNLILIINLFLKTFLKLENK